MIDAGNSWVGSTQRVDAKRGRPARYIELVLGEAQKWDRDLRQYVAGAQTTHDLTPATARKLAKALLAEARICEGKK